MTWFMGGTGAAATLPVLEEYNHDEISILQLAEAKGRRAERAFIVSLIRQAYKNPTRQMLALLARLETNGNGAKRAAQNRNDWDTGVGNC